MNSPKLKEVIGENIFKRFYFINHNEYINLKIKKKKEENKKSCQLAAIFYIEYRLCSGQCFQQTKREDIYLSTRL